MKFNKALPWQEFNPEKLKDRIEHFLLASRWDNEAWDVDSQTYTSYYRGKEGMYYISADKNIKNSFNYPFGYNYKGGIDEFKMQHTKMMMLPVYTKEYELDAKININLPWVINKKPPITKKLFPALIGGKKLYANGETIINSRVYCLNDKCDKWESLEYYWRNDEYDINTVEFYLPFK